MKSIENWPRKKNWFRPRAESWAKLGPAMIRQHGEIGWESLEAWRQPESRDVARSRDGPLPALTLTRRRVARVPPLASSSDCQLKIIPPKNATHFSWIRLQKSKPFGAGAIFPRPFPHFFGLRTIWRRFGNAARNVTLIRWGNHGCGSIHRFNDLQCGNAVCETGHRLPHNSSNQLQLQFTIEITVVIFMRAITPMVRHGNEGGLSWRSSPWQRRLIPSDQCQSTAKTRRYFPNSSLEGIGGGWRGEGKG